MSKEKKSTEPTVIELEYPIEWGKDKEPVSEITLKRPKGKHIKNLDGNVNMAQLLGIASKVSGRPPVFFDEMDAADVVKVTEAIGDFLESGPKTGETV